MVSSQHTWNASQKPNKKRLVEAKEYLKHGVLFQQPFKEIPSGTLLTVAWRLTSGVFYEGAATSVAPLVFVAGKWGGEVRFHWILH